MFIRTTENAIDLIEEYFGSQVDYKLGNIDDDCVEFLEFLEGKELSNEDCQFVMSVWEEKNIELADRDSE